MTPTENGALTLKGFSVGLSLRPIPVEGLPEFGQTHCGYQQPLSVGVNEWRPQAEDEVVPSLIWILGTQW